MDQDIGKELYKIMDALVALKIDLECDPQIAGDKLVLSAEKARSACEALDSASVSIKHLVAKFAKEQPGGGAPLH
jgi:hypothetical protein